MNLEAVEFIERHENEPFFLYLSHYAVHAMVDGKQELVDKYAPGEIKIRGLKSRKRNRNKQISNYDKIKRRLRNIRTRPETKRPRRTLQHKTARPARPLDRQHPGRLRPPAHGQKRCLCPGRTGPHAHQTGPHAHPEGLA